MHAPTRLCVTIGLVQNRTLLGRFVKRPYAGRRGYGFAITLLSLRNISPIRGIFTAPYILRIPAVLQKTQNNARRAGARGIVFREFTL